VSGAGNRNGPKSFEIPDLDLPPPRASQSSLKAVIQPESGRLPSSGSTRTSAPRIEEDFEASLSSAPLALELEGPISAAGATVARGLSQEAQFENEGFELDSVQAPPLPGLVVAPEGRANWPMGVTATRGQLQLDPIEIRLLANYGAPPTIGPLNALYAVRVTLRKKALKTALRSIEHELLLAEAARDAELAELAQDKLPEIQQSEGFRRLLSPLSELESLANDRGRALSATNAEQAAELGRFDAELAAVQRELEAQRAARTELTGIVDAREQTLRRIDARYKRIFIDMRALEQQAAQRLGPAGGEMPADLHAQLLPLKAQADALKPELEGARAAAEGSRAELSARMKASQQLEERAREIERKKAQLRDRYRHQLSEREQGLDEAVAKRRNLLADVGRAVLASRGGVSVDERFLENLRRADAKVLELVKKSELHVVALDSCDDAKVKSGFAWIFGTLALLAGYALYRGLLS
jgi:hypothetical protein